MTISVEKDLVQSFYASQDILRFMNEKKFSTLNLSDEMLHNLNELGYKTMTPVQEESLPLVLDGLDVIAQHNIQKFLRYYQEKRKITILLTSHYMKDVAALCKRVVIIAGGRIEYDGSLSGIIDKFSGHKVLTLQFADGHRPALESIGEVLDETWPKVRIRVDRADVPRVLADVLRDNPIEDVAVEDIPLEEVIADLFRETSGKSSEPTKLS